MHEDAIVDTEAKAALGCTLKSIEEARSSEVSDIPDHVAESVAGQNILVDLRISELLDTAAKLFDRALRQLSAIIEESAYLAQELQKVANGQSSWTSPRMTSASATRPGRTIRSTRTCSRVIRTS